MASDGSAVAGDKMLQTTSCSSDTGLCQEQKEKAMEIWNMVRTNQKFHGIHFYQRLMTEHPDYQDFFSYFKQKQMDHLIRDRDPRFIVQALRMMLALDTIFINLDKPDKAIDFCYKLGHRHLKYGLKAGHFKVAQTVLLQSLSQDLSDQVDAAGLCALNAVLDIYVPHIIRGLEYARIGVLLHTDSVDTTK